MGPGSDSSRASLPSSARRSAAATAAHRARTASATWQVVQEDAFLRMREEWMQARKREQAAEEKLKQMAAQLARTEEAAKRILTRCDPSARGGTAAALLLVEGQLTESRQEVARLQHELAMSKRQAADSKRQVAELRKRLDSAGSSQRRLALQVGRMRMHGGSPACQGQAVGDCAPGQPSARSSREAEQGKHWMDSSAQGLPAATLATEECASADRMFAQQQEQLVAAQEAVQQLQAQLQQQQRMQDVEQPAGRHDAVAGQQPMDSCHRARPAHTAPGCSHAGAEQHCDLQSLRLKYLKSKVAVESLTASNTRLLRELDCTRAAAAEAQQRLDALATECSLQPGSLGPQQRPAPAQELAAACRRAQRLQIELDAALAELAVHRASQQHCWQPHLEPAGASRTASGWPPGRSLMPYWRQEDGGPAGVTRTMQASPCVPRHAQLEPLPSGNPPPRHNVLVLHLHSAELLPEALDQPPTRSPPLTFLTADFYDASTQLSSLAQGLSPLYETTVRYIISTTSALLAHLRSGSIRVELHACSHGADVRYATIATAVLPLAGLLNGTGAGEARAVLASRQGGAPCGSLLYSLSAASPLHGGRPPT